MQYYTHLEAANLFIAANLPIYSSKSATGNSKYRSIKANLYKSKKLLIREFSFSFSCNLVRLSPLAMLSALLHPQVSAPRVRSISVKIQIYWIYVALD